MQGSEPSSDLTWRSPRTHNDGTSDRMADRTLLICTCLVFVSVLLFAGAGLLYMYTDDARNNPPDDLIQKNSKNMKPYGPLPDTAPSGNPHGCEKPGQKIAPGDPGDRDRGSGGGHETSPRNEPGSLHEGRSDGPMMPGDDNSQKRSDTQSSPVPGWSGPDQRKASKSPDSGTEPGTSMEKGTPPHPGIRGEGPDRDQPNLNRDQETGQQFLITVKKA